MAGNPKGAKVDRLGDVEARAGRERCGEDAHRLREACRSGLARVARAAGDPNDAGAAPEAHERQVSGRESVAGRRQRAECEHVGEAGARNAE